MAKTLTPDQYEIINIIQQNRENKQKEIGFKYKVNVLTQPTRHSCWAVSTTMLLQFADIIIIPTIHNISETYSNTGLHFLHVADSLEQMYNFLANKDLNKARKYKELYTINDGTVKEYEYDDLTSNNRDVVLEWIRGDKKELWDTIKDFIKSGEFGRFQEITDVFNALVNKSLQEENDRRDSFELREYEFSVRQYLPNEDDSLNVYKDNEGQVLHVTKAEVENIINEYFKTSDSSILDISLFNEFFIELCGLNMEKTPQELLPTDNATHAKIDEATINKMTVHFSELLCKYGPLLINYIDTCNHMVILCGISIYTINDHVENIRFIVMDPWEGNYRELYAADFLLYFCELTNHYASKIQDSENYPPQIFHLPENTFSLPKRSEILIHLAQ